MEHTDAMRELAATYQQALQVLTDLEAQAEALRQQDYALDWYIVRTAARQAREKLAQLGTLVPALGKGDV